MADNLAYKDTVAVIKDFKDFINGNLSGITGSPVVDPLADAGKGRGSGTFLAVYEDDTKQGNFPKLTFETVEVGRTRMAGGKANKYSERHRHEFAIKYMCMKQHIWTYNGIEHKGKQQCIKYLQYLGDKIKQYSGSFDMKEIVLGTISNPKENPKTHDISSMMLIKVDTFGKIGD